MTIISAEHMTTWELNRKFHQLARRVVQLEEEVSDLEMMNSILINRIEELEKQNEA